MIEMVKTGGSTKESSYGNTAVSHVPDHLLTERIAIEAMKVNGEMLQFIRNKTHDVILAALINTPVALGAVPHHMFTKKLLIEVIKHNWKIIKGVDDDHLDGDVCTYALLASPKAAKYIPSRYKE